MAKGQKTTKRTQSFLDKLRPDLNLRDLDGSSYRHFDYIFPTQ